MQEENEKVRNMVNDLSASIKAALLKMKTTSKPKPKVEFTKRNEDVEGIHNDNNYINLYLLYRNRE